MWDAQCGPSASENLCRMTLLFTCHHDSGEERVCVELYSKGRTDAEYGVTEEYMDQLHSLVKAGLPGHTTLPRRQHSKSPWNVATEQTSSAVRRHKHFAGANVTERPDWTRRNASSGDGWTTRMKDIEADCIACPRSTDLAYAERQSGKE